MQTSKIKDVTAYLEKFAPKAYQESYDNSGLLVGDPNAPVSGVLVTLDCTEAIVEEAINSNCNLIVAHHPILFKGIKKLTGQNYVERTLMAAIKNDISIYATHTNLDNIHHGVNKRIADKIGLTGTKVLLPRKGTLSKLVTFIPAKNLDAVLQALYAAGAGQLGKYSDCSFQVQGTGTFKPAADANPHIGKPGQKESVHEVRAELIFPSFQQATILAALEEAHPYEEVAYYVTTLENENEEVGSGLVGELETSMEPMLFLERLKSQMSLSVIRHTLLPRNPIKKIAVCGGAGSFLLGEAISQAADVYVSSDFKYHEFFDADGKIVIADVGHYESEQFTKELLAEVLSKKFSTFAINFSKSVTNPVRYL